MPGCFTLNGRVPAGSVRVLLLGRLNTLFEATLPPSIKEGSEQDLTRTSPGWTSKELRLVSQGPWRPISAPSEVSIVPTTGSSGHARPPASELLLSHHRYGKHTTRRLASVYLCKYSPATGPLVNLLAGMRL